jgi:hypothetical protein
MGSIGIVGLFVLAFLILLKGEDEEQAQLHQAESQPTTPAASERPPERVSN